MGVRLGYKRSEGGVIPQDWELRPIGGLGDVSAGGTPSRTVPEYWNGDVPWVTTTEINSRTILDTTERITALGLKNSAAKMLASGSILLALYGQGKTRGKVAVLGVPAATNQACAAITVSPSVSTSFVYHSLNSRYSEIRALSNSGSQENLSGAIVKAIPIPLPPTKAEQEAIASALSDADALIESMGQLLAKKRHLKQGAMQELLTGKKRLPGFTGSWPERTLASLLDFSGGLSASRDQLSGEGHCYLHYGDIHGASKAFIDVRAEYQDIPKLDVPLKKVAPRSLLADGDVVFVDASEDDEGTSRHMVILNRDRIPFISGLHTIVAKSRTDELSHLYRRYCFQTRSVKRQFRFFSVGTKVSGISKTNITKVSLPVPPIAEQEAIAGILAEIDLDLVVLEAKLTKARQIKQGMMQELLTGKIRLV